MNDTISRQAVLNYPIRETHYDKENGNEHFISGIESVIEWAENLPSVIAPQDGENIYVSVKDVIKIAKEVARFGGDRPYSKSVVMFIDMLTQRTGYYGD